MFLPVLKRFAIVISIVAFALFARAQQTHFIYLQTEGGQPFYIKIDSKIVSSSAAGYLILPKLADGDYKLSIGFPKNEFPEENFQILVDKKNEGFLLKNFGEKGWGLFNMQSYGVLMGGNTTTTAIATPPKNLQDDPFSKLLANVVKDSSILQKNDPVKEEVKKEPVKEDVKNDSLKEEIKDKPVKEDVKNDTVKEEIKKEPAKEQVPVTQKTDSGIAKIDSIIEKANSTNAKVDSTIAALEKPASLPLLPPTRFLNKKDKEGREMIYIDHNQNLDDTIRIFIPSGKSIQKAGNVDTGVVQNVKPPLTLPADSTTATVEQPVPQVKSDTSLVVLPGKENTPEKKDTVIAKKTDEAKQPGITPKDSVTTPANKTEITKHDEMVVLPKVVESSTTNSDCKAFASSEDFLKLRKKMASGNSDDDMIKAAKKVFHLKCFSTEQIKNLSFLFLTNSGKYMFFDMAYPSVSDADQYNTLESQLTDSYYINRFKAMIHK